jgi:alpha-2-macroglobulin
MQLIRSALALCAAFLLALAVSSADAAERKITLLPGTDLPGSDYSTLKGVTLDACQTACQGDNLCHAFTYNQKAKWCFLKSADGTPAAFKDATSGRVAAAISAEDLSKARQGELPFPP